MYTYITILLLVTSPSLQDSLKKSLRSIGDFFEVIEDAVNTIDSYDEISENGFNSGRRMPDSWPTLSGNEVNGVGRYDNPDVVLTVPEIIQRNGYICETHTVISQGYVLQVHRIPRSKYASFTAPTQTVILHHGLFGSSADWILNGPGKALAYVLSDAGYDVWLPNIRGNRYSRNHMAIRADTKDFWNFSWHDVALLDVPVIIDYIMMMKGSETRITYIGHSMGTTILFAMLSLRPEYNERLVAGLALAPEVFLSDVKSPMKSLAPIATDFASMESMSKSHEFLPKDSIFGDMTNLCDMNDVFSEVCMDVLFNILGSDKEQFNKTLLPVFMAHFGTSTSMKTVMHYAQEVESGGRFQYFDYGRYYNRQIYGSDTPPEYDLSRITLPIKLFWAQNDLLSSEKDVRKLFNRLPPWTEMFMVPDPNFNHIDYLLAIDAPRLLNDEVLRSLDKAFSRENKLNIETKSVYW